MKTALITSTGSVAADITLKSLKRMGFRVVGCNIYPKEWIVESCEMDVFYQAPPVSDQENYLAFMKDLCVKEKVEYLLPMIDYEIDLLNCNREWFEEQGVTLCMSPKESLDIIRNKKTLAEFIEINCPDFKGLEADRYSFYRVPKALVKADLFQKMSGDAKLLYAVLLDRMSLSIKNGWQDKHGNAYIICTIFQSVVAGESIASIARALRAEKIPIPSEHWKRIGAPVRAAKYTDPYAWSTTTISYILKRPEYTGRKVLGKTVCENYKTKSTRKTAPEEQYIFDGEIPAIVDEETWNTVQRLMGTKRRAPKRQTTPNRLTGLLYCADCGAKLTHRSSLVQGKYLDDAFVCSSYRQLTRDCTMHYIPTAKMEAAILAAIQRVSWYVRHNEAEFIERVREATDQHQENAVKEYRQKVSKAQRRCKELDGLVKKLYEGNATGKIPDKHFTRLLAEYDEEQTGLEAAIAQWQEAIESWNADRLKTDKFIELVSRYTDFSELTTPMLNEFIEKVVVHEGEGRGNSRRQRIDIYLNFIGAFEVPAHIVTPMEAEEQRRQQEEQAAKEARSQELAKAREEKRKAEKREFTARKKAGLLTPEEQAADEARLAHNRAWQKEWREKRKAAEPPKPPKPKSLKELAALQKAGADLTPEEAERLAAYREKKNRQHKAWYERQKAAQPPKPRTLKELAAALDAGQTLTPEETERLEASRSRKKNAYQELKTQAETDPAAAAELARRRAYHSEATKKSRQKMYEEAAAGNPEAQARYENFLAARRENYHKKKQDEKGEQIA
jgi:hypothetical protein